MPIFNRLVFILKYCVLGLAVGLSILFFMPQSQMPFNWQTAQQAWQLYKGHLKHPQSSNSTLPVNLENFTFAPAVQKAYPSVVRIYAFRPKGVRKDQKTEGEIVDLGVGFGSGIILDDGNIVTNYHVVENAERISITLDGGRNRFVNLVGFDKTTDIAVLNTDIKDLPSAELANSSEVLIGDIVMAIGSPFGAEQSVSLGIVSAITHDPTAAKIQTDAAINDGNSGGPLINAMGQVIGINQMTLSSRGGGQTGISAAIPIDIVKNIVSDIIEHGRVRRNWLGIQAGALNLQGYREFFPDIEYGTGIIVTQIDEASPGFKAGIKINDLVIKIGGKEIKGLSSFYKMFYDIPIGGTAKLEVIRNGKVMQISVKLFEA